MKEIPLTQGKVAIVDDEDYEYLKRWKWHAQKDDNTYYVNRTIRRGKKTKGISMHRLIMRAIKGEILDHENHNGLDNRKENLRFVTQSQNNIHSLICKSNKSSKHRGVHFVKKDKRFRAIIKKDYKKIYIGQFKNEDDAGRAYDKKAKELFGEFAVLNFPNE